ncbi:acyl carrier protein [Acetatifactor muris]|jgi:acyl carrier protein|uniref:acyl carrier protein n=1 Tax=Acetatifactor muris TaxID=879566 RepID=UPI0023F14ABA|nr:acyl carrier protein [Acetatifactor muris]
MRIRRQDKGADGNMDAGKKREIIALIEEALNVPAGTITEDTMIADVEEWDSLAHVMIIGELEERLGISVPLEEAVELTGVRELLEKCVENF